MTEPEITPAPPAPPSPASDVWPTVELVVGLAVIWSATLAQMLVFAVVLGVQAARTGTLDPDTLPPLWLILGGTLVDQIVTLSVAWFILCYRRGVSIREGFRLAPMRPAAVSACIALALAMGTLGALIPSEGKSMMAQLSQQSGGLLVIAIIALTAPFVEEVYYRGLLFGGIERLAGARNAAAIIVVWFAAVHAFQLAGDWLALGLVAVMGAIWTQQRIRTGSVSPSFVTHLGYNASLVAMAITGRLLE